MQMKKDYCVYETFFYINLVVTIHQKFRTETQHKSRGNRKNL